jgi:hypothetical protein
VLVLCRCALICRRQGASRPLRQSLCVSGALADDRGIPPPPRSGGQTRDIEIGEISLVPKLSDIWCRNSRTSHSVSRTSAWASGHDCRDGEGSDGDACNQLARVPRRHQAPKRRSDSGWDILRDGESPARVLLDPLRVPDQHVDHFLDVTDGRHVLV